MTKQEIYETLDTINGTLTYKVIPAENSCFKGEIKHDLHKNPRLKDRVLTRYSKVYKTVRGVTNWLDKQISTQNTPLV